MKLVFADFETFWSRTHSLTRMNPVEYIMHEDTQVQSLAVKVGKGKTRVLWGEAQIQKFCESVDWSNTMLIGHNMSEFDALIFAWRFGVNPKMWGCTLAMARPLYAKTTSLSLANLAAVLNIEVPKLSLEETNTKGKRLEQFTPEEKEAMREYNIRDTYLCYRIFKKLIKRVSLRELKLIDMTIRMMTELKFEADIGLLRRTLNKIRRDKEELLANIAYHFMDEIDDPDPKVALAKSKFLVPNTAERAEVAREHLASQAKFAKFLERKGVRCPMKPSPTNSEKMIPALAKSDQGMMDLTEHEDPEVAAAANARLKVKSTILETRLEHFISVAKNLNGKVPCPLRYYGADTTGRWSGIFRMNMQNLPRVSRDKEGNVDDTPTNALRLSLRAPEGYVVVVADLSGIELRINHFLWRVESSISQFKADPANADLYRDFAATFYAVPAEKITKDQRQVGKVAQLGLGFGSGAYTFQTIAKVLAGITLSIEEAEAVVFAWRDTYPEIVRGWRTCHEALERIYYGDFGVEIDPWGLCKTTLGGIKTPKGVIRYPQLHQEESDDGRLEWVYGSGRKRTRIYAGKVTENIVQHLAREALADMALKIAKTRLGQKYGLAHAVHDELIYVVREEDAQEMLDTVQQIMRAGVDWWPELITWSEGDIAQTYGHAK